MNIKDKLVITFEKPDCVHSVVYKNKYVFAADVRDQLELQYGSKTTEEWYLCIDELHEASDIIDETLDNQDLFDRAYFYFKD